MKKIISALLLGLLFFPFKADVVSAANATMTLSPQSGTFDKPFSVNLIIDGHGERFNAAEATITIPTNLKIQDLLLGDCNFSFLKTPSIQNPSFAGVLLSAHSTKCTVYTLALIPAAKNEGTITLSKASVKRYGDAANILSSTKNGTYKTTKELKSSSLLGAQTKNFSQTEQYTVNLKIFLTKDNPITNSTVTLNPVSKKDRLKGTTNSQGLVTFSNIKSGVYSVTIEKNMKKVGETIINVSGTNHDLTLGINLEAQKNNPLLKNTKDLFNKITAPPLLIGGILIFGIIMGSIIPIVIARIRKKDN